MGFEGAVVVFVFENDEAIPSLSFFLSAWIGIGFGDPDSATTIEGESNGLAELRFTGNRGEFFVVCCPVRTLRGTAFGILRRSSPASGYGGV